jgi:hypothetical protein
MKIDYLHGQRVEAVKQQGPNWHWEIYLEGGAIIRNKDQRRTAAPSQMKLCGYCSSFFGS